MKNTLNNLVQNTEANTLFLTSVEPKPSSSILNFWVPFRWEHYEFPFFYTYLDMLNPGNHIDFDRIEFIYKDFGLVLFISVLFIFVNIFFKITAAPFHTWAQSVYESAPLLSATFLSIFSKLIIVILSIQLMLNTFWSLQEFFCELLFFIGIITMIFSILGAISETVIKRFYVYSSMTHVAFMLFGIGGGDTEHMVSVWNYLSIYVFTSLFMWFFLYQLSNNLTHFTNLKLIFNSNPLLGVMFSIVMFSAAGIPPLSGFFVKYQVLHYLTSSGFYYLTFGVLLLSILTFVYYLRLVKIVHFENVHLMIKKYNNDDYKLYVLTFIFFFLLFYCTLTQLGDDYILQQQL